MIDSFQELFHTSLNNHNRYQPTHSICLNHKKRDVDKYRKQTEEGQQDKEKGGGQQKKETDEDQQSKEINEDQQTNQSYLAKSRQTVLRLCRGIKQLEQPQPQHQWIYHRSRKKMNLVTPREQVQGNFINYNNPQGNYEQKRSNNIQNGQQVSESYFRRQKSSTIDHTDSDNRYHKNQYDHLNTLDWESQNIKKKQPQYPNRLQIKSLYHSDFKSPHYSTVKSPNYSTVTSPHQYSFTIKNNKENQDTKQNKQHAEAQINQSQGTDILKFVETSLSTIQKRFLTTIKSVDTKLSQLEKQIQKLIIQNIFNHKQIKRLHSQKQALYEQQISSMKTKIQSLQAQLNKRKTQIKVVEEEQLSTIQVNEYYMGRNIGKQIIVHKLNHLQQEYQRKPEKQKGKPKKYSGKPKKYQQGKLIIHKKIPINQQQSSLSKYQTGKQQKQNQLDSRSQQESEVILQKLLKDDTSQRQSDGVQQQLMDSSLDNTSDIYRLHQSHLSQQQGRQINYTKQQLQEIYQPEEPNYGQLKMIRDSVNDDSGKSLRKEEVKMERQRKRKSKHERYSIHNENTLMDQDGVGDIKQVGIREGNQVQVAFKGRQDEKQKHPNEYEEYYQSQHSWQREQHSREGHQKHTEKHQYQRQPYLEKEKQEHEQSSQGLLSELSNSNEGIRCRLNTFQSAKQQTTAKSYDQNQRMDSQERQLKFRHLNCHPHMVDLDSLQRKYHLSSQEQYLLKEILQLRTIIEYPFQRTPTQKEQHSNYQSAVITNKKIQQSRELRQHTQTKVKYNSQLLLQQQLQLLTTIKKYPTDRARKMQTLANGTQNNNNLEHKSSLKSSKTNYNQSPHQNDRLKSHQGAKQKDQCQSAVQQLNMSKMRQEQLRCVLQGVKKQLQNMKKDMHSLVSPQCQFCALKTSLIQIL